MESFDVKGDIPSCSSLLCSIRQLLCISSVILRTERKKKRGCNFMMLGIRNGAFQWKATSLVSVKLAVACPRSCSKSERNSDLVLKCAFCKFTLCSSSFFSQYLIRDWSEEVLAVHNSKIEEQCVITCTLLIR